MTEAEARARVIRSMCPDRVCRVCGEPSRRITEMSPGYAQVRTIGRFSRREEGQGVSGSRAVQMGKMTAAEYTTVGFTDCGHDDWRPGVWLDPFQTEEGVMLTLGNIDQ